MQIKSGSAPFFRHNRIHHEKQAGVLPGDSDAVKKEKKRSLTGKAWGVLEIAAVADVVATNAHSATGNPLQIRLSSKPIDFKTYKSKKTVVKGSSSHIQLKLKW